MSTRTGILAGGNWIVDKIKFIDTWPQQDALANILGESIGNGGSPFNVLVDLAKLGAIFPLDGIGLIGADSEGRWIEEQCARHGINASHLRIHEQARTSYTEVMSVRSTGRRTFFHQRGANAFLDDGHFDFPAARARIFHLGYLLLLDRLDQPDEEFGTVAARVLSRAREAGCKTSVDVVSEDGHRFAQVVPSALPYVDYCILNEFEIERTAGIPTRDEGGINLAAVKEASQRLLEAGVKEWVIVHFPEGACALGHGTALVTQGSVLLPQSHIVSTVGAGDAFAAGVLYGLHEGLPIEKSLLCGVTAAASCLSGAGASDGVKTLDECLALEQTFGSRNLTKH